MIFNLYFLLTASCVFDLCAMYMDGSDADQTYWVHEYYKMLNDSVVMQYNTIGNSYDIFRTKKVNLVYI